MSTHSQYKEGFQVKKLLCTLIALCLVCGALPMALAEGVSGTFEG